ncbi:MAG: GNAT family N-acetyltransferase [Candidatus Poribacteria bacterium]
MPDNSLMGFDGPRIPYEHEEEAIGELCRSIFFSNSPNFQTAARTWPMGLRAEAMKNSFVIFDKGCPVSLIERLERDIAFQGHKLRLGYIGSVCTNSEYRKLGMASTVLSATMKRFHENNVDFVCISGNREMYKRAGSRFVGGLDRLIIKKEGVANLQTGTGVRIATIDDALILAHLNEQEPLHSVRPINDYEIVINYGHCVGKPVEFIIASIGEVPTAYVLVTKLIENNNRKYRRVMEYAGDRFSISTALARLAINLPDDGEIEVDVQEKDNLIKILLASYGADYNPTTRPGTNCVLDFVRTMTKLKPFFAGYLPEDFVNSMQFSAGNERYSAWCPDGSLSIEGMTDMVWTLLGPPPGEKVTNIKVEGKMQDLIDICLPIPLPPLEMNMI